MSFPGVVHGRSRGRLLTTTSAVVAVLGGVATNQVQGPWWIQITWFGVAVVSVGAAGWLSRRGDPPQAETGAGQDEEQALLVRVYNFEEYVGAQRPQIGSRLPGILLNQLLRLQVDARRAEGWNPVSVWGRRDGPPFGDVDEFRRLAPCVMVTGYIERADGAGRYAASIRVSLVQKNLATEALLVEEIEFEDSKESMTAALGDLAARTWRESASAVVEIDQLLSNFLSSDEEASERAREALLALGPVHKITERLAGLLDNVQLGKLVELLAEIGDREAGPGLLPLLANAKLNARVARLLGAWGFPAALPVLREQLVRERDAGLLATTVQVICGLGDTSLVPTITPFAAHAERDVRLAAVTGLRALSSPAAVPVLLDRLSDEDSEVCDISAMALAELGDPAGVDVLLRYVASPAVASEADRERVVRLVSALPSNEVLPGLRELLRSDDAQVRGRAAEMAGNLGDPATIEALVPLVSDEEYLPRFCALRSLSLIADEGCLPALLQGMSDEHANCVKESLHGYVRIGRYRSEDASVITPLISNTYEEVRFYAAWLLAQWGEKTGLSHLVGELSGRYLMVEDWFQRGGERQILGGRELFQVVAPLVPSVGEHSRLELWAAAVRRILDDLTWDGEAFKL